MRLATLACLLLTLLLAACSTLHTVQAKRAKHGQFSFYLPVERSVFHNLARKIGTDKVATHRYSYLYIKYLESTRKRFLPLKVLEVGLVRAAVCAASNTCRP